MLRLNEDAHNRMLDNLASSASHLSLHTAFSNSGAYEVTGGSYTREAVTWASASGGDLYNDEPVWFDVPPSTTVKFIGLWSASASATFYGMIPLGGGTPEPFVLDSSDDTLRGEVNNFADDDVVIVTNFDESVALPAELTEGESYYVINKGTDPDDLQLSATQAGAAINFTSDCSVWLTRSDSFTSSDDDAKLLIPARGFGYSFGLDKIALVGSETNATYGSSTNIYKTYLNMQPGDVLVAIHGKLGTDSGDIFVEPADPGYGSVWNEVHYYDSTAGGDHAVKVYYYIVPDGEPTDGAEVYTFFLAYSRYNRVDVFNFRGVSLTDPIDSHAECSNATSVNVPVPSYTPAFPESVVMAMVHSEYPTAGNTSTPPSPIYQVIEETTAYVSGGSGFYRLPYEKTPTAFSPGNWVLAQVDTASSTAVGLKPKAAETPWDTYVSAMNPFAWWRLHASDRGTDNDDDELDATSQNRQLEYNYSAANPTRRIPGVPGLNAGYGVQLNNAGWNFRNKDGAVSEFPSTFFTGDFCFGFWLKLLTADSTTTSTQARVVQGISSVNGLRVDFNYNSGNQAQAISWWYDVSLIDSNACIATGIPYDDGDWHLILFEYDSSLNQQQIRVDGVVEATKAGTGIGRPSPANQWQVYWGGGTTLVPTGWQLDEYLLFDRKLTSTEHQDLYAFYFPLAE